MTSKKNPLGPTGSTVASNVKRLRGAMTYKELSESLERIGRPIPALGLRRIEAEERRVDADDLVALAIALNVTPNTLLMQHGIEKNEQVEVTGHRTTTAERIWLWLTGMVELNFAGSHPADLYKNNWFLHNSRPVWDRAGNHFDRAGNHFGPALNLLSPEAKLDLKAHLDAEREVELDAIARGEHGDN